MDSRRGDLSKNKKKETLISKLASGTQLLLIFICAGTCVYEIVLYVLGRERRERGREIVLYTRERERERWSDRKRGRCFGMIDEY